jgi:gliding motility-associated-like protein
MMKRAIIFAVLLAGFSFPGRASHITGGEMYYTFIGVLNGEYRYSVTLKLFQRCFSGRQFPNPIVVSVFDKTNGSRVLDLQVPLNSTSNLSIANYNPCISNPPVVCYDVAYYSFTVSLPGSPSGYTIASQVNFRINGINNLAPGSNAVGATYTAEIPGNSSGINTPQNNSAAFKGSDLVVVCANNEFTYSFAASDDDGDDLRYSFCHAYRSTTGNTLPPNAPPYPSVPYNSPDFGGESPLGDAVHIDPTTGLITGIAPGQGIYVVTVCVDEIRGGVVIATQRKDLQINIADCSIAAASLLPEYILCGNTQTVTIDNLSTSPLINTYDWEVFNSSDISLLHSTNSFITYNFPDTGIFFIELSINRGQLCADSTHSIVRVYPGFVPDFKLAGTCITKPTIFTDQTTSVYGNVDSWTWDFGETSSTLDFSQLQDPVYTYPYIGSKNARLIVTDTKGCRDTVIKTITINDKPPVLLAFSDTLICIPDQLQLQAGASGIFSWSPPVNITNANTSTPTVSPLTSITYYVDLNDNGCLNRDSVKINVVDHVNLQVMNDTTICRGDKIRLIALSDGLLYTWLPASQFVNPSVQNPYAITNTSTNYQVTATIGGCSAQGNITVTAIPYPSALAGADTSICYNTLAQLNGETDGSSWHWLPEASLNNALLLNPVANPPGTTAYIFMALDTKGCPKPGIDTILVTVQPKINPSAGADTAIVTGQPLHMNATGGNNYIWTPADFLSAANIPDPVALFNIPSNGVRYKVVMSTDEGCVDSAFITVRVFKTAPTVFVPTAFTPNGDGRNDVLKPIAAGITNFEYFKIFDRWGQLVFSTTTNGLGWDGRINGLVQPTGVFIWMVKASDYNGAPYFEKGTVTLIR